MTIRPLPTLTITLLLIAGCAQQPRVADTNPETARPQQAIPAILIEQRSAQAAPEGPPAFEDVWDKVVYGMDFSRDIADEPVMTYLEWYGSNQQYFDRTLERAERYMPYVVGQLEEHQLPMELALLPFVESAYNPFAYSHQHAAGLWQFIPGTGRAFGLRQDRWYEGRRDLVDSTDAAIRYLSMLNQLFDGDWLLTLAAYNAGQGTVRRAIAANERRGEPTDFWSLPLPRETRAYVPRLIALSKVLANPEAFNIERHSIAIEPGFAIIELEEPIDLAQAARMAGISTDEIYQLNPGFSRWVTPPSGPHRLLLPVDRKSPFLDTLAATPMEQWRPLEEYTVVRGDTLGAIARRHGVSIADLRDLNNLRGSLIREGQQLKIPGSGIATTAAGQQRHYEVRKGDSLWSIARERNLSLRQLMQANGLSDGDILKPGQKLVIAAGTGSSTSRQSVQYRVRQGDSLYEIARRYGVNIRDLLSWNNISRQQYLQPGQQLRVYPAR